jgi:hypothetical protein
MKTIEQSVIDAFANIAAAGTIEKAIEAQINKTITEAVSEHLRSYSDFGKQLNAAVKTALAVDMDHLSLPRYNDLIVKLVRASVAANVDQTLAARVQGQIEELLQPAPAEIKLSKLIEDFIKHAAENNYDDHEFISLHVERSTGITEGYVGIYLDKAPRKSKYSCAIQIDCNREGEIYSLKIDEKEIGKTMFVGPTYGFERDLIDGESDDDFETYYPGRDD